MWDKMWGAIASVNKYINNIVTYVHSSIQALTFRLKIITIGMAQAVMRLFVCSLCAAKGGVVCVDDSPIILKNVLFFEAFPWCAMRLAVICPDNLVFSVRGASVLKGREKGAGRAAG